MIQPQTYTQQDTEEITNLLIGRRIIQAEMGQFAYPLLSNADRNPYLDWTQHADARLTLDDGTVLYLTGNEGCGGCPSGNYDLEKVATVDNIITSARIEADPDDYYDDKDRDEGYYRIYVIAEATEINVAEFVGTDGNGYYGTGFELTVIKPAAAQAEDTR